MPLPKSLRPVDIHITAWMAKHGVTFARVAMGIVFFWFGILKFFPGLSPAEQLAGRTIERLTFGMVTPDVAIPILATWECLIGIGLLSGVALRAMLLLLFAQMFGTLVPLARQIRRCCRFLPRRCDAIWNNSLLSITACPARSARLFPS